MSAHMYRANDLQIWSVTDLQKHYEKMHASDGRGHWFKPDTMRFFNTLINDGLFFGPKFVYFITSELGPSDGVRRRYSIREYDPETGEIKTVGVGFQGYKTLAAAKLVARKLADRGES